MIGRVILFLLFLPLMAGAQTLRPGIDSFRVDPGITVASDLPQVWKKKARTVLIFYALPNGNSLAHTMGKTLLAGDDWHVDIQHIRAQTDFLREEVPEWNWVVIYLANDQKSWPAWKKAHPDFAVRIPALVDSLAGLIPDPTASVYLFSHSGGGSFMFGYLAGTPLIPGRVERLAFIDSDYGYDSSYYAGVRNWLQSHPRASLQVFAYNDSVAMLNGKPVVSPTGGTWYRSRLWLRHLQQDFQFTGRQSGDIMIQSAKKGRVQFYFKDNPDRGIYHTQQVELNGFIQAALAGTKYEEKSYQYYGPRAYRPFIR